MARRPVFVTDDVLYVKTVNTEFKFYNGLSKAQKQRSSESLHEAFKRTYADSNVLEVSSFSNNPLGNKLSAFNLLLSLKDRRKAAHKPIAYILPLFALAVILFLAWAAYSIGG